VKNSLNPTQVLTQTTLNFLTELNLNNSREWLGKNKAVYEKAKEDILVLTEELIAEISAFDKTISKAYLDPKKCVTRLNRDLRFTKFKIPYKTDFYIVLSKNGKNSSSAFYFLHIEPGNCFVGGGVYNPQPQELRKIRQAISLDYPKWTSLIKDEKFQKTFPSGIHNSGVLKKVPKEFNEENKASEFLKMKGFFAMEKITDKEITQKDTFQKINFHFKTSKPLVDFLNAAIEK